MANPPASRLGPMKKQDLSWLTERNSLPTVPELKSEKSPPELPEVSPGNILQSLNSVSKRPEVVLDSKEKLRKLNPLVPQVSKLPEVPSVPLGSLRLDVPQPLIDRLYSEVFHDLDHRTLREVVAEILNLGLSQRPYRGPASDAFLARMKRHGRPGPRQSSASK